MPDMRLHRAQTLCAILSAASGATYLYGGNLISSDRTIIRRVSKRPQRSEATESGKDPPGAAPCAPGGTVFGPDEHTLWAPSDRELGAHLLAQRVASLSFFSVATFRDGDGTPLDGGD